MLNKISIDEASKDFTKVVQNVREHGSVVIVMNEEQYILQKYDDGEFIDSDIFRENARRIVGKNIEAFRELAK